MRGFFVGFIINQDVSIWKLNERLVKKSGKKCVTKDIDKSCQFYNDSFIFLWESFISSKLNNHFYCVLFEIIKSVMYITKIYLIQPTIERK